MSEQTNTPAAKKVTYVTLDLSGDKRRFQLIYPSVKEMEDDAGAGPMELYQQITTGRATVRVLRAILAAGLKGGGDSGAGATADRIMADYPFGLLVNAAESVLAAYLVGVDEPTGQGA